MATVMEFTSPVGEFPLGSVFENLPGVTVELERLIPHETLIIPYFWVRGAKAREYCQGNDIPITIIAVHAMLPIQGEGYELTETQREALVLAYERGYFDTPRETSLEEIADEIGITQQSLSSRLRRGHRRLIKATLSSSS